MINSYKLEGEWVPPKLLAANYNIKQIYEA
jgi:hypothetical protein